MENACGSCIENTLPGILDVLDVDEKVSIFNTSSDTVNRLLRGLSSTNQNDSIKKLTEETASVLPSFAKALDKSSQPTTDELPFHSVENKTINTSGM